MTYADRIQQNSRAVISFAVTKGWIHRSAGEAWFRITKRAANELKLPGCRDGRKIPFIDGTKMPKSLPAFDEPKKPVLSEDRAQALIASLRDPRDVIAQAKAYQAVISKTGWPRSRSPTGRKPTRPRSTGAGMT